MTENTIAKTLRTIGIIEAICGGILGFIALFSGSSYALLLFIACIIAGFINGMMFVGFGEIINLLQKGIDKQDTLITLFNRKSEAPASDFASDSASGSFLNDIESNLPKM